MTARTVRLERTIKRPYAATYRDGQICCPRLRDHAFMSLKNTGAISCNLITQSFWPLLHRLTYSDSSQKTVEDEGDMTMVEHSARITVTENARKYGIDSGLVEE